MKTIFTLMLGSLITGSAFASNITLNVSHSRHYQVQVDGRTIAVTEDQPVDLTGLGNGKHSLRVYRIRRSGTVLSDSAFFGVSPQFDVTINIANRGHVQILRTVNKEYKANTTPHAITERNFDELIQNLRGDWTNRMETAKEGLAFDLITTIQLRQVLQFFPSQRDRLELTEQNYARITDKQNFKQLYDLYSRRTQKRLETYLAGDKK